MIDSPTFNRMDASSMFDASSRLKAGSGFEFRQTEKNHFHMSGKISAKVVSNSFSDLGPINRSSCSNNLQVPPQFTIFKCRKKYKDKN